MIKTENLQKVFRTDEVETWALNNVSIEVKKGEFVAIMGPSGCGKSTLLNILGLLDNPTSGTYYLDGIEVSKYTESQRTNLRKGVIGFVFQSYNLIPHQTILENVELAAEICRDSLDAVQMLKDVGLEGRMDNFPAQLSGGEQQRVSIARALAKNPKIILCDEPTGALDYHTGKAVLKLLQDTCQSTGKTVLIITHNSALTRIADRVIRVKNGTVIESGVNDAPLPVERIEW